MRKTLVGAVIGALVAGAMVGGATIALAQADVIKERQQQRRSGFRQALGRGGFRRHGGADSRFRRRRQGLRSLPRQVPCQGQLDLFRQSGKGDGVPVAFFFVRFAGGKRKGRSLGERPAFWTARGWGGWVNGEAFLRCGKGGFAVVAG